LPYTFIFVHIFYIKLTALAFGNAKKKKIYFIFSNTILSILPTHFTTHLTSQFLFLHTT